MISQIPEYDVETAEKKYIQTFSSCNANCFPRKKNKRPSERSGVQNGEVISSIDLNYRQIRLTKAFLHRPSSS